MYTTVIAKLAQEISKNSDEIIVELAKASLKEAKTTNRPGDLRNVQTAIVEVLLTRYPEAKKALDVWEHDLDDERNSLEVIIDWGESDPSDWEVA